MLEHTRFDAGERYQRDLFNFATFEAQTTAEVSPRTRELIDFRCQVQQRMRAGGYVLKQSGRFSPADLAGMDYVLYSTAADRYFFIDVTTDVVLKWSLPQLRKLSVFKICLDESGAVDLETKRQFLERLLQLMESPTLFTLSECPFPSLLSDFSPRQVVAELEKFRNSLESCERAYRRLGKLVKERAVNLATAEMIREYRQDLVRLSIFATEEDTRQTCPNHLAQQQVFEKWAETAAETAVRATIAPPGTFTFPQRRNTHSASFDDRRDQIVLFAGGRRFKLANVGPLLLRACDRVWARKQMKSELYVRKTLSYSGMGQTQSAEHLVRLIETTLLTSLLGETFPMPTPVVPKGHPGRKGANAKTGKRFG